MKKTSKQRRDQRKRSKERQMHISLDGGPEDIRWVTGVHDFLVNNTPMWTCPEGMGQKKKDKTMYIDENYNADAQARQFLLGSVNDIYQKKSKDSCKFFGLMDDDAPVTPAEIIDRIKTGMFTVPQDRMEKRDFSPYRWFQWRDPSKKEDKAGFKKAEEALNTAQEKVCRAIMVKTPTEALTEMEAFENTTFH